MKLVILDRDGVINEDSDDYIKSPDEWIPIPGSLQAIARLNHAGYRVAVATNQSGLARGLFDISALNAMHQKMHRLAAQVGAQIDAVFFCPHGPDDGCHCRKPLPGLLLQIAKRFSVNLEQVTMIGDNLKDIEAARLAGARPWLVRTGKGRLTETRLGLSNAVDVFDDLPCAVAALLKEPHSDDED